MPSSTYTAYLLLLTAMAWAAGCRQPWYAASDRTAESVAGGGGAVAGESLVAERPVVAVPRDQSVASTIDDPFEPPKGQSLHERALSELVAELQQAEEIDPGTREKLLADLRAADPANWPLIVHRVRATLAYRRQQGIGDDADGTGSKAAADATDVRHGPEPVAKQQAIETPRQIAEGNAASAESADASEDLALAFAGDAPGANDDLAGASQAETGASAPPSLFPGPEAEPAEFTLSEGAGDDVGDAISVPQVASSGVATASFEEPVDQQPSASTQRAAPAAGQAISLADRSWQQLLDLAITRLEEATDTPPATGSEIAAHARLRLLHVAAGNQSEALRPIEGVPSQQQDFWSRQLSGLYTYMDEQAQPDPRRRASLAQRHLAEALDLLGESAILIVHNLTFCKSVRGFGIYEPLDRPKFQAGEQVKLYAEVDNYRSEQTEEGYRTLLATSYEILDESDRRADSGEFPQVEDICRSRRRDFHIQYGVNLPTRIDPGTYRLELTIEDELSRKIGTASVEFEIVDDESRNL